MSVNQDIEAAALALGTEATSVLFRVVARDVKDSELPSHLDFIQLAGVRQVVYDRALAILLRSGPEARESLAAIFSAKCHQHRFASPCVSWACEIFEQMSDVHAVRALLGLSRDCEEVQAAEKLRASLSSVLRTRADQIPSSELAELSTLSLVKKQWHSSSTSLDDLGAGWHENRCIPCDTLNGLARAELHRRGETGGPST